jgi:hypothetical protein
VKDGNKRVDYCLDPLRFEAFKTELDALGEYSQYDSGIDQHTWGKTFAMWRVFSSGNASLQLYKADNSEPWYDYIEVSGSSGRMTDELLRKYMGPEPQTWGKEEVYIYYLDPLRFDEFKAELDAGGEYLESDSWTENRDWDEGLSFVQWAVRPNGEFVLRLCNADNSVIGYNYKKVR